MLRSLLLPCLLLALPAFAANPFSPVTGVRGAAAGEFHSCLVLSDGTVECFGLNEHGQLGDGSTKQRVTAGPVAGLDDAVQVVAGAAHSCALREGGTVACWGRNDAGQVGNGADGTDVLLPTAVAGLVGVTKLSAGAQHTCAITEAGTAWCWGANTVGQLGDGTTTARTAPVAVALADIAHIDGGGEHTCAVTQSGAVFCWGSNAQGQLGTGDTTPSATPVAVTGLPSDVSMVAAGPAHTCALRENAVACWGRNSEGETGGAASPPHLSPSTIDVAGVDITAGDAHTCVLGLDARINCWGATSMFDQGSLPAIAQIDSTHAHVCATRLDGLASCRGGSQFYGERGTGYAMTRLDAVEVLDDAHEVEAGTSFACALDSAGLVRCWGQDEGGSEIFGENVFIVPEPRLIPELSDITALTAADFHVCALKGTAAICWGGLGYGEVGFDTWTPVPRPVMPVAGVGPLRSLRAGAHHTCSVTETGAAVCWGLGPVGDGSVDNAYAPVTVSGLSSGVAQVVAGAGHRCALLDDGTVKCWGRLNTVTPNAPTPVIGDGSGQPQLTPVTIDLQDVVALAAGRMHTCALLDSGRVRCWGVNDQGQLGDGTHVDRYTPVEVPGLENVSELHAGPVNTCAIFENGSAACWGRGTSGQLGNGKRESSLVPAPVTVWDAPLADFGIGETFVCAVSTFGELRCWGANSGAQLGEAGLQDSFGRPVQRSLAPYRVFGAGFEGA